MVKSEWMEINMNSRMSIAACLVASLVLVSVAVMVLSAPVASVAGINCMIADWSIVPHAEVTARCTSLIVRSTAAFSIAFLVVSVVAIVALFRFKKRIKLSA